MKNKIIFCSRRVAMFIAAVGTLLMLASTTVRADPNPASSAAASTQSNGTGNANSPNHMSVDPCALLTARDATSVVGAVNPTPQRPAPNECLWSAASLAHGQGPVSQVLFTVDAAQEAKHGCHGFGCVSMVQSVSNVIPGTSSFNNTLNQIGGAATTIEGLGQRAAWSNGVLAVLQNQLIFKLKLSGTQSDMLDASEQLAHKVLNNMQGQPTPQAP